MTIPPLLPIVEGSGGGIVLNSKPILFSELIDFHALDARARRLSPSTIGFYSFHLGRFCQWADNPRLTDITPAMLRAYLAAMQEQGLAAHTVHGTARAMKTVLRFAVREGLLEASPMAQVRMPRLPKGILPALEPAEARAMVAACENERDRAAILFLLDTGLRASEFCALDGADVDVKAGIVRVRSGKGDKARIVYLGAQAQKALARYYLDAGKPGPKEPAFRSLKGGRRIQSSGLRQLVERIGRRALIGQVGPHMLRRTFALWSLRAGMNIYVLARLMGHADIQVLRQYLALVDSDLADAHARYGAVDQWLAK